MKKIATLGPPGTFSEAATLRYIEQQKEPYEIQYYSSIKSALRSIGSECELGILPIENLSEGFISVVLDYLVDAELSIIGEIYHQVKFSFASHVSDYSQLEKLYVQYVAKGQCAEFIDSLGDIEIINTESNIDSLKQLKKDSGRSGAIIPSGSIAPSGAFQADQFCSVQDNVGDYDNNQTRFLVFSKQAVNPTPGPSVHKTSIVLLDDNDCPGLLSSMLLPLSDRGINLTTIISRPTRKMFGRYYIFIDFIGCLSDPLVQEALADIQKVSRVKVLGSYKTLG